MRTGQPNLLARGEAVTQARRVLPVGLVRAVAVVAAAALLLASSCTWQLGGLEGLPPPAGDPVPPVDTHAPGRPADQLYEWASRRAAAVAIPVVALEAYAYAARVADVENPKCQIAWTTLAGIGQVESRHGTYHGATLAPNGDVRPPIRGVRLDGTGGTMRIVDSELDSRGGGTGAEPVTTRAMGPMQFIPETWREYGVAANDAIASPDNIDDAALTAAGYLCWRGKNLKTAKGWLTALRAYNNSLPYARTVRDWATAYAAGHRL